MSEKQKKSVYKRWWFIALALIFVIGVLGSCGDNEPEIVDVEKQQVENEIEQNQVEKDESDQENVSREYKNALRAAQNYVDMMPFSNQGLFDQLTSEYGDQYPAEAAQYAVENVKVNWNEEALEAAINYLDVMPMSDQELFDQLTSEYGDKFTEEQAQYAINNLPD